MRGAWSAAIVVVALAAGVAGGCGGRDCRPAVRAAVRDYALRVLEAREIRQKIELLEAMREAGEISEEDFDGQFRRLTQKLEALGLTEAY